MRPDIRQEASQRCRVLTCFLQLNIHSPPPAVVLCRGRGCPNTSITPRGTPDIKYLSNGLMGCWRGLVLLGMELVLYDMIHLGIIKYLLTFALECNDRQRSYFDVHATATAPGIPPIKEPFRSSSMVGVEILRPVALRSPAAGGDIHPPSLSPSPTKTTGPSCCTGIFPRLYGR